MPDSVANLCLRSAGAIRLSARLFMIRRPTARRGKGIVENGNRSRLRAANRSEEHTSELQSLAYLVCRLLLEKKKKTKNLTKTTVPIKTSTQSNTALSS